MEGKIQSIYIICNNNSPMYNGDIPKSNNIAYSFYLYFDKNYLKEDFK